MLHSARGYVQECEVERAVVYLEQPVGLETNWLQKPLTGAYFTDFLASSSAIAKKSSKSVLGRRLFCFNRSSLTVC